MSVSLPKHPEYVGLGQAEPGVQNSIWVFHVDVRIQLLADGMQLRCYTSRGTVVQQLQLVDGQLWATQALLDRSSLPGPSTSY